MNNRTNEITSWKPLTGWQRLGLKFQSYLAPILIALYLAICLANGFLIRSITEWTTTDTIGDTTTMVFITLTFTTFILFSRERITRVKDLLALESKVIVCRLTKDNTEVNAPRAIMSGPIYRAAIDCDRFLLPEAQIKIVAPLRNGVPVDIYLRKSSNDDWQRFNIWRIELVEAHWGFEGHETMFRLIDDRDQTMVVTLGQATDLIWLCADSGDLAHFFPNMLVSLAQDRSRLRSDNDHLIKKYERLEAGCGAALGGVLMTIDTLLAKGSFPRARIEADRIVENLLSSLLVSDVLAGTFPGISALRIKHTTTLEEVRERLKRRARTPHPV